MTVLVPGGAGARLTRRGHVIPVSGWLLAPLLAPARTHPPVADRIAAVGARPPTAT